MTMHRLRRLAHAVLPAQREEQARAVVGRLREARSSFDRAQRQALRDDHAARVALVTALREDSNAIDVGANEGAVLADIVRLSPRARHIAYEPIPELHARLAAAFPGVDVRRAAASDTAGTSQFSHVVGRPAYSGLRRRADLGADAGTVEQIPVVTERLDDVLDPEYVPALIKIDVEGAELHVMRGAAETIARHRPFVLFEHGAGGADAYGSTPGEVHELLTGAGLRIFDLEGDGPYSRDRFEDVFPEPIWNFLATPA